jgi:hypothetical protein
MGGGSGKGTTDQEGARNMQSLHLTEGRRAVPCKNCVGKIGRQSLDSRSANKRVQQYSRCRRREQRSLFFLPLKRWAESNRRTSKKRIQVEFRRESEWVGRFLMTESLN